MARSRGTFKEYATNLLLRVMLGVVLLLPYRVRVPAMGWLMSRVVAPLAGYRKRVRNNLAHVLPDLPQDQVERLCRMVPDNTGRSLIEIYSGDAFVRRAAATPVQGPGLAALENARANGRPVVLVTGHFGNYDAPRAALIAQGFDVGALYKPMQNRYFNAHYERAIARIGRPIFPKGRRGLAQMVKFLRGGGVLGFFIDNRVNDGAPMTFFGKPAMTTLSAAEMALKYDALLLSVYGIRQPDGLSFKIHVNEPVPHSTANEMTQVLTKELEDLVRQHMEQWFWIHKRWGRVPSAQRNSAAP